MKTQRITLLSSDYCKRDIEYKNNDYITIHFLSKTFLWDNKLQPYYKIKRISGLLFALVSDFRISDLCFRPKWYQVPFVLFFVYWQRRFDIIKYIIKLTIKMFG